MQMRKWAGGWGGGINVIGRPFLIHIKLVAALLYIAAVTLLNGAPLQTGFHL